MDVWRAGLLVSDDLGATYPDCPLLHCTAAANHTIDTVVLHAAQCTLLSSAHRIMNTKCAAITCLPVQHLG